MKNIKLRLTTTLSILIVAFSGSALANDWEPSRDFQAKKNKVLIASTIKSPVVAQRITKQPLKNRT